MPYLEIHELDKSFTSPGGRVRQALHQVCLELEKGQILSVIGHNGSGKTTLLNSIRGVFSVDRGEILVDGQGIRKVRPRVVSVYQDVDAGVVPSMTAMENLALVMSGEPSFLWSFPCRRYKKRIYGFLDAAGLSKRFGDFEHTVVTDLSGGQRQQLAIVMAMLREPEILLLDEFVANLDPAVSADILSWSKDYIRKKNITTVMVTHDHALAESWGDYVLELCDGEISRLCKTDGGGRALH